MTALKTVMRQRNIKYFSQLTAKQKSETQNFYLRAKLNILSLDSGLQLAIIRGLELDRIFEIYDQLKGTKMFYYDKLGVYLPLNISELLKAN